MADMNVALVIRFLTEGRGEASARTSTPSAQAATAFKQSFNKAISEGFTGANIDAALKDAETKLNRARGRLMDAVAMGAMLAAPIRAATQFEEAFADLDKVLDAPVAKVNEIRNLDPRHEPPDRPVEHRPHQHHGLGRAGRHPDRPARTLHRLHGKAAVAFDMAAGEIGDPLRQAAQRLPLDQEGLEQLADAANHLSNSMAAKADEITNFTNRAAGSQRVLKLTAVEMEAVGASLVAAGIVPETAARGLNAFADRLAQGTDDVRAAFATAGMSYDDFMASLDQDAPAAITELFRTLSEVGNVEGAQALIGLMGQDFSDDFGKLLNNPDLLANAFKNGGRRQHLCRLGRRRIRQARRHHDGPRRAPQEPGDLHRHHARQHAPADAQPGNGEGDGSRQRHRRPRRRPSQARQRHHRLDRRASHVRRLPAVPSATASRSIHGPLLKLVNLFLRFDEAGKNVSLVAKAVRLLAPAFTLVRTAATAAFAAIGTATRARLGHHRSPSPPPSSWSGSIGIGCPPSSAASPPASWARCRRSPRRSARFADSLAQAPRHRPVADRHHVRARSARPSATRCRRSATSSARSSRPRSSPTHRRRRSAPPASASAADARRGDPRRHRRRLEHRRRVVHRGDRQARRAASLRHRLQLAGAAGLAQGRLGGGGETKAPRTGMPARAAAAASIPPLGTCSIDGAANASAKIKTDAERAGQTLGKTAGKSCKASASIAGQAFGRAAAAEISRAKADLHARSRPRPRLWSAGPRPARFTMGLSDGPPRPRSARLRDRAAQLPGDRAPDRSQMGDDPALRHPPRPPVHRLWRRPGDDLRPALPRRDGRARQTTRRSAPPRPPRCR